VLQALNLVVNQFGTVDEIHDHIRYALSLGLPEFTPALCSHDGYYVIVGSGPSMPSFVEEIREERARGRPLCAVKGTHDFLIERGLAPDLYLTIDPRPRADQLKLKSDNTIYLIASRCHPDVFKRLKNDKVILWHSFADQDKAEPIWEKRQKTFLVGGGSTSGMRAINMGYMQGFRNFILYGFDSCLASDGRTKRFNGDQAGQTMEIRVGSFVKTADGEDEHCDPSTRVFITNTAMGQQAKDFVNIYRDMPDVKITAKGDGLIAAIIAQRKAMGLSA